MFEGPSDNVIVFSRLNFAFEIGTLVFNSMDFANGVVFRAMKIICGKISNSVTA